MTLDPISADALRAARSMTQAQVDQAAALHDVDDYSARERASFESQAMAIVKIT